MIRHSVLFLTNRTPYDTFKKALIIFNFIPVIPKNK